MTYAEWVHSLVPGLTDDEVDYVLWEWTPFPLLMRVDELEPYVMRWHGEYVARSTHLGAL